MQITLSELKDYLKNDDALDDTTTQIILSAAISFCETKLNRPILDANMTTETTWEVPEEIRLAIYLLASHWYENRLPIGQVTDEVAFSISSILASHRFWNV